MEPELPKDEAQTEFDWFDEAAAERWRTKLRQNRAQLWLAAPLIVACFAFPPAAFFVVRLLVGSVPFYRLVKKWDADFDDGKNAATAIVTEESFSVSRPDGSSIDVAISDIAGYVVDLHKRHNLKILLNEGSEHEFRLYIAEIGSSGLWQTLARLDELIPRTARREIIDREASQSPEELAKSSLWRFLIGVASLLVSAVGIAFIARQETLSGILNAVFVLTLVTATVGVAILILSLVDYRRSRILLRTENEISIPGQRIAYYRPNLALVGTRRAWGWLALLFSCFMLLLGIFDFSEFMLGLILGPAFLALAVFHFQAASIENRTVIVTDQYVAVVVGRRCFVLRHGQYRIYRGWLWFGFQMRFPVNVFTLASPKGYISFTNRSSENGYALWRIAEFSTEAQELAVALGLVDQTETSNSSQ